MWRSELSQSTATKRPVGVWLQIACRRLLGLGQIVTVLHFAWLPVCSKSVVWPVFLITNGCAKCWLS